MFIVTCVKWLDYEEVEPKFVGSWDTIEEARDGIIKHDSDVESAGKYLVVCVEEGAVYWYAVAVTGVETVKKMTVDFPKTGVTFIQ